MAPGEVEGVEDWFWVGCESTVCTYYLLERQKKDNMLLWFFLDGLPVSAICPRCLILGFDSLLFGIYMKAFSWICRLQVKSGLELLVDGL